MASARRLRPPQRVSASNTKPSSARPRASPRRNRTGAPRVTALEDHDQDDGSDFAPPSSDSSDAAIAAEPQGASPARKRQRSRRSTQLAPRSLPPRPLSVESLLLAGAPLAHPPCLPPRRRHATSYHAPLLLLDPPRDAGQNGDGATGRVARGLLLDWFRSVSHRRAMPWRKEWIDPSHYHGGQGELRDALKVRAYEVWISEIMLQQTRVATVIDYWTSWMRRWPTVESLASASRDDVLSAWRGLGYYSRATRIHEAAQRLASRNDGLLPADAESLQRDVAGVGAYTAGAISAIVFGRAAAMVDGNVVRVLCRQLGLLADPKSKAVNDVVWDVARRLVDAVARQGDGIDHGDGDGHGDADVEGEPPPSELPGLWGQALMELGSTVCTPKPNCSQCPIKSTCRAYGEGEALAVSRGLLEAKNAVHAMARCGIAGDGAAELADIEECTTCESILDACDGGKDDDDAAAGAVEGEGEESGEGRSAKAARTTTAASRAEARTKASTAPREATRGAKQTSLTSFFPGRATATRTRRGATADVAEERVEGATTAAAAAAAASPDARALEVIESHVRRFPLKVAKKKVREQHCVVVVVRDGAGRYLIEQRPDTGLLASLWEFPSTTLADDHRLTSASLVQSASASARSLLSTDPPPPSPAPSSAKGHGRGTTLAGADTPEAETGRKVAKAKATKMGARHADTAAAAAGPDDAREVPKPRHVGSVPHVFSHLKLTMHVCLVRLGNAEPDARGSGGGRHDDADMDEDEKEGDGGQVAHTSVHPASGVARPRRRWASADDVEAESMGTGMRKCWHLALEHDVAVVAAKGAGQSPRRRGRR